MWSRPGSADMMARSGKRGELCVFLRSQRVAVNCCHHRPYFDRNTVKKLDVDVFLTWGHSLTRTWGRATAEQVAGM